MSKSSENFEASMARLDQIVKSLEKGDVPLSDALKLFEEGTKLVSQCGTLLDEAEQQSNWLLREPFLTGIIFPGMHNPWNSNSGSIQNVWR